MHELEDPLPVPVLDGPFDATIRPPGSKSITCRAYLTAALAEGTSRIVRPLRAEDTDGLLHALTTLGVKAAWDGESVEITGVAGRFPRGGRVDLGDGGTPARFMLAAALLGCEPIEVDGSPRLRERPVAEGLAMLEHLGATVTCLGEPNQLPVRIAPSSRPAGGRLTIEPTRSSQFISALLLVAPWLEGGVTLEHPHGMTSRSYVSLTVDLLRAWGVDVESRDDAPARQRVAPGRVAARTYEVEPDASSAVYWWIAAAIGPAGSRAMVAIPRGSMQPDAQFPSAALAPLGADVSTEEAGTSVTGRGGLRAPTGPLDLASMPDAAVGLGAALARADGPVTMTGLHTLAVKETDRLAALATELQRLGCTVECTADTLTVDPRTAHAAATTIETYHDHRMAMAFAVLGLARGGVRIDNPSCIGKSYPGFFADLRGLTGADATQATPSRDGDL